MVGVTVEALREADHPAGLGVAKIVGIEVTEPDAVEAVGVLQQLDHTPMRMVRCWFAVAVHRDSRLDRGKVVRAHSAALEQFQHFGKSGQSRPGLAALGESFNS